MGMHCVEPITCPQLIAEIGDIRRFTGKSALVAFAGVDAPPFQSGVFDVRSRRISKRGSPHLRRTLFLICTAILQHGNLEGKHFYVYMVAGAAKFIRIYYAKVTDQLNAIEGELRQSA